MWQLTLAVLGAWCIAIGAAAQERPAADAAGEAVVPLRHITRLASDRRWLAGTGLTVVGVGLHLLALASAPVTIVQPLGVSGLLVAVWLSARWRGRRLSARELLGCGAVTAGLAGLVLTLPHHGDPVAPTSAVALPILCVLATLLAAITAATARRLGAATRGWLLAAVAGVCFGLASALARMVADRLHHDPAALWHWTIPAALALIVLGGQLLQNAYRSGHFGLAYATLLVTDPVIAAATGALLLDEPLPHTTWGITAALIAAAATTVGVVVLAGRANPAWRRNRHQNDDRSDHEHDTGTDDSGALRAPHPPSRTFHTTTTSEENSDVHCAAGRIRR
jgi:drug/metabolite transporter (DMT)-like permease